MERWTISLRGFRRAAIITTIGVAVLVVAGGIVRLTGSGLGCDDWPSCNSERFVDVSSGHTAIEQVNRLLSGLIAIPALIMGIGAFRVRPRRSGLVGPSVGVLVTIFGNAVVGGLAVRGDLHPALVQSHFLLAMASITFGMVAVERARPGGGQETRAPLAALPAPIASTLWGTVLLTAAALVTGTVVTGTGPHAGDEDVRRWGFDISAVARLHSVTVLAAVAAFLALVWVVRRDAARWAQMTSAFSTWLFLAVVQGAVGYFQYFTGVPEMLVGAHLAGATALWAATVHLAQVAGRRPADSHSGFARVSVPA